MNNAELIAEARDIVSWNLMDEVYGANDDLLGALADEIERLNDIIAETKRITIRMIQGGFPRPSQIIECLNRA